MVFVSNVWEWSALAPIPADDDGHGRESYVGKEEACIFHSNSTDEEGREPTNRVLRVVVAKTFQNNLAIGG